MDPGTCVLHLSPYTLAHVMGLLVSTLAFLPFLWFLFQSSIFHSLIKKKANAQEMGQVAVVQN